MTERTCEESHSGPLEPIPQPKGEGLAFRCRACGDTYRILRPQECAGCTDLRAKLAAAAGLLSKAAGCMEELPHLTADDITDPARLEVWLTAAASIRAALGDMEES